jgi:hypothetical protein
MDMIPKWLIRGPLAEEDPLLNYEDPILLNEINRKMGERIKDLKNKGIGVKHEYGDKHKLIQPLLPNKSSPGWWYAYNPTKSTDQDTIKKYGDKPFVNVPRTPTLDNYLTLAEEAAHAENKESREIYPKGSPKGEIMNTWLEEVRAKNLAKKEVGGHLTPHAEYLHNKYLNTYLANVIDNILLMTEDYEKNEPEIDWFAKMVAQIDGKEYTPGPSPKEYWDNELPIKWVEKNYPDLAKRIRDNPDVAEEVMSRWYY